MYIKSFELRKKEKYSVANLVQKKKENYLKHFECNKGKIIRPTFSILLFFPISFFFSFFYASFFIIILFHRAFNSICITEPAANG